MKTRIVLCGAIITSGIATAVPASAATFSARETHSGLRVNRPDGTTVGRLATNGWFRRSGAPDLVYREGGVPIAGIWESAPAAAVVRSGTTEKAPIIGRIVPSWNDGELSLTIEPAGGVPVRTTVFERVPGGGAALDRDTSTRFALEGTYRATLHATGGADAGWLSIDVDPEGATRFSGDLPPAIPPALAAAAAAAVEDEVDFIYGNVIDVAPFRR